MKKKILSLALGIVTLAAAALTIVCFANGDTVNGLAMAGATFLLAIATLAAARGGIAAVVRPVHDGTPPGLR
jgi:hypothetical protein